VTGIYSTITRDHSTALEFFSLNLRYRGSRNIQVIKYKESSTVHNTIIEKKTEREKSLNQRLSNEFFDAGRSRRDDTSSVFGVTTQWVSIGRPTSHSTNLISPSISVGSGTIIFPVSSTALVILQDARMDAIATQKLFSATYCPVQILGGF
jgi:hypothetical protein